MNKQLKLTRFQRHVLAVVCGTGPASYDEICQHCRQSKKAVRKAVYRMRRLNLIETIDHQHDGTEQGRWYLVTANNSQKTLDRFIIACEASQEGAQAFGKEMRTG